MRRATLRDDQTFARATGAALVGGNSIRLLKDGQENYPAWLDAIASATRTIHLSSYIIHGDDTGLAFAEALAARARAGVRVRVLCDWFGSLKFGTRRVLRVMSRGGAEVRIFNPPSVDSLFGWISRDHRKMLIVDGDIAFVSGLCIGQAWVGDPVRHIEPWRDTGVAIRGPAVADVDRAFATSWAIAGSPIPPDDLGGAAAIPPAGDVAMRVVVGLPSTGSLYRFDQLVAAAAERTLWLTDAYFVATSVYVQSLKAAVEDGVDVRLLVPGSSDVPLVRSLSRAGYRPLLEAGVRVFEWNGSMLHAKTAVADARWARVGSSNLNITSWLGNWELDVAVEHPPFAEAMEQMFLDDLEHATEVVLTDKRGVGLSQPAGTRGRPPGRGRQGHGRRAAAGAIGISSAAAASIANRRALGPAEAKVLAGAGVVLLAAASVLLYWPRVFVFPLAALLALTAVSLLLKAARLRR